MDDQQNPGSPSAHHRPSEDQNNLNPECLQEGTSSSSYGQTNSYQEGGQEASSTRSSSQATSSTPVCPNELSEEETANQRQNGSSISLNAQSSIRDQARVAVVIYDMLIRAGPQAETLSAHLAQAYPAPAALARHYAMHASLLIPYFLQRPATNNQRRGSLVLRRVSVSSVAWFCFFVASIISMLRLWMIFSFAVGATIASMSNNGHMYRLVDRVVRVSIERGPKWQLYRWMLRILNQRRFPVAVSDNGETASGIDKLIPDFDVTAVLITPITSGILGFIVGVLAALCINSALRAAGGIRLESYEDRRER